MQKKTIKGTIILVSAGLLLAACSDTSNPEAILKTTTSNLPRDAEITKFAEWLIIRGQDETPLLLSGATGNQRAIDYQKDTGYSVINLSIDCKNGVNVTSVRTTQRDRGALLPASQNNSYEQEISAYLPDLCSNPEGFQKIAGDVKSVVTKMRSRHAIPTGADEKSNQVAQAKDGPKFEVVEKTITLKDGTKATVFERKIVNQ